MCHHEAISILCCQTCMLYESGELFVPAGLPSLSELNSTSISDDYSDDYYEHAYGDEDGDYDDATEDDVDNVLQFPTRTGESDPQTPIIVDSGIGVEQNQGSAEITGRDAEQAADGDA